MILYSPEEIKKIMEDNYDKSMDLPAFYHNLLVSLGLKSYEWPKRGKTAYLTKEEYERLFKPAKTPLFTSEDGVPIYEDSELWYLDLTDEFLGKIFKWILPKIDASDLNPEKHKWFSAEAAAKAYWDKHKPKEKIKVLGINWDKEAFDSWGNCIKVYIPYQTRYRESEVMPKLDAIKQAIEDILNK